jgi:hypothetical protein
MDPTVALLPAAFKDFDRRCGFPVEAREGGEVGRRPVGGAMM